MAPPRRRAISTTSTTPSTTVQPALPCHFVETPFAIPGALDSEPLQQPRAIHKSGSFTFGDRRRQQHSYQQQHHRGTVSHEAPPSSHGPSTPSTRSRSVRHVVSTAWSRLPSYIIPERKSSRARQLVTTAQEKLQKLHSTFYDDARQAPEGVASPVFSRPRMPSPLRPALRQHLFDNAVSPSRPSARTPHAPPVPSTHLPRPEEFVTTPILRHRRLRLCIKPSATLFVAGASISGFLTLRVVAESRLLPATAERAAATPALRLVRLTVGLLGLQSYAGRHHVFHNLAVDVAGPNTLPPELTLAPPGVASHAPWAIEASTDPTVLPFSIPFGLADAGPPSCAAGRARVRYLLCCVAACTEADGALFSVRDAREVTVVAPLNPNDNARLTLPAPLTAQAALVAAPTPSHNSFGTSTDDSDGTVILTASLRRGCWFAGLSLFLDVAIVNPSRQRVRSLELALERTTTILSNKFKMGDLVKTKVVMRRRFGAAWKQRRWSPSRAWEGMGPKTRDERTWILDVPKGQATVVAGRLFAINYELVVTLRLAPALSLRHPARARPIACESLTVRLPVTILHPSSLDLPPHAVSPVRRAFARTCTNAVPPAENRVPYSPRMDSLDASLPRVLGVRNQQSPSWRDIGTFLDPDEDADLETSDVSARAPQPPEVSPAGPPPAWPLPLPPLPPVSLVDASASLASPFRPSPLLPARVRRGPSAKRRAAGAWEISPRDRTVAYTGALEVPRTRHRASPPEWRGPGPRPPDGHRRTTVALETAARDLREHEGESRAASPWDGYPPAILDAYASSSEPSPAAASRKPRNEGWRTPQAPLRTPPRPPLALRLSSNDSNAQDPGRTPLSEDVIGSLARELEASPRRRRWQPRRSHSRTSGIRFSAGDGAMDISGTRGERTERRRANTTPQTAVKHQLDGDCVDGGLSDDNEESPLLRVRACRPKSRARSVLKAGSIVCPMPRRSKPARMFPGDNAGGNDPPQTPAKSSWSWVWSSTGKGEDNGSGDHFGKNSDERDACAAKPASPGSESPAVVPTTPVRRAADPRREVAILYKARLTRNPRSYGFSSSRRESGLGAVSSDSRENAMSAGGNLHEHSPCQNVALRADRMWRELTMVPAPPQATASVGDVSVPLVRSGPGPAVGSPRVACRNRTGGSPKWSAVAQRCGLMGPPPPPPPVPPPLNPLAPALSPATKRARRTGMVVSTGRGRFKVAKPEGGERGYGRQRMAGAMRSGFGSGEGSVFL